MISAPWQPTCFKRFEECVVGTSTRPARIVTDAGRAYLKAMNNPMGPHALAREWVGTRLADWFGLDTFDMAILHLEEFDEVHIDGVGIAEPGPCLLTRAVVDGTPWGGDAKELELLDNPEHISRIVVFDTWTRNADRHPPAGAMRKPRRDNVFFSPEGATSGRFRLVAMDHTECFVSTARELNGRIAGIEAIKDEGIYGLFPEFKQLMDIRQLRSAEETLREIEPSILDQILDDLPSEWQVSVAARGALSKLVIERAAFLADNVVDLIRPLCWPGELSLG